MKSLRQTDGRRRRTTDGRTDDGRCAMTIAHSSLRLRWAKKHITLKNEISLNKSIFWSLACLSLVLHNLTPKHRRIRHYCQGVWVLWRDRKREDVLRSPLTKSLTPTENSKSKLTAQKHHQNLTWNFNDCGPTSLPILVYQLGSIKEWVSFFWVDGEWIGARDKKIAWTAKRFSDDLFVPRSDSFPINPEKKTFIPYIYNVSKKDPS